MTLPAVQMVPIGSIKANPSNPRQIKDERFRKLVRSIREFPEMLRLRPIVVNADHVVLGGNMRLKACKEAKLTEVPIVVASDLTEAQQAEFIIKDNVGFGDWDWDTLANEWEAAELTAWGLDVAELPSFEPGTIDDQGKLDEKKHEMCPHCGGLLP
jgi:ParB-like chromosome segregation protein Spo0J